MKVSVIISSFNGAKFLPKLLDSLQAQEQVDLEIIVVDRESRDDSAQILSRYPKVKICSEPPETGLVSGYHRGTKEASGEAFFFINEDMWFEPDCLQRLVEALQQSEQIGAVDPWQWTYDGKELIHAAVRFQPTGWDANSPYPRREIQFLHQLAPGTEIPLPCAGAVLVRRTAYEQVGGWDTSFFLNDEDTDLGLRLWQNNWRVVTESRAKVYHAVGSANLKTIPNLQQSVSQRRYVSTFANKAVIGWKHYRKGADGIIFLSLLRRVLSHLVKGRGKFLRWEWAVWQEMMRRKGVAMAYRTSHEKQRAQYAGEDFFTDARFQA